MQHIVNFFREEDGLAVTEYGLLLAIVAVAVVAVIKTFGTKLTGLFSSATTALPATP
ncbi:MAG: Flp/Fap pilin component [Gemmatimonadetes bacterium]|nr:Flp/Fap pilin component [Gemmatimonadota bacterium]